MGSTSAFFSNYADHSKQIVRILKEGYGNKEIFGSVDDFEITYPSDPKIEDIGIVNKHLEKDYPLLWELKEEFFKDSEKHLRTIEKTIMKFKNETQRIIEDNSEFKDYSKKSVQKTNDNKYYYPEIFLEIFIAIKDLKQNKTRGIAIGSNDNETINVHSTDTSNIILSNDYNYDKTDEYSTEFRELIKLLIYNEQL
ncbi:MAG: hypothetical protein L0H55_11970, partial [Candidatus Nitrosocosmicus sp.]|nr:hypothetical protein [Candidatus Nitrosocosmicus sp.]